MTDTEANAREDLLREIKVWASSDQAEVPDALADELIESGWQSPDDVNALRNLALAYNTLMWRLAIALGLAEDGDEVIDVDFAAVKDQAIAAIRAQAGTTVDEVG